MSYWPWWTGAIALGGTTVGYYAVVGRTIGVSGAFDRVLNWREERMVEKADAMFEDAMRNAPDLDTELRQATSAERATDGGRLATLPRPVPATPAAPKAAKAPQQATSPVPVAGQALFLIAMLVGGIAAAVVSGRFQLRGGIDAAFGDLVSNGWAGWAAMFVGGALVGFGTRLAGGCSSGHGLSGCGRLQIPSFVATAVFFGTAVAFSFLLWKVI